MRLRGHVLRGAIVESCSPVYIALALCSLTLPMYKYFPMLWGNPPNTTYYKSRSPSDTILQIFSHGSKGDKKIRGARIRNRRQTTPTAQDASDLPSIHFLLHTPRTLSRKNPGTTLLRRETLIQQHEIPKVCEALWQEQVLFQNIREELLDGKMKGQLVTEAFSTLIHD